MKKITSILIVVLLIAGGAFCYFHWKRSGPLGDLKVAGYLPSETIALVEITDLPRTKTRWKETAIYKISQEPAVAAFLEKPKTMVPHNEKSDQRLQWMEKIDPKEIFIAATGQAGGEPNVIAGFDFKGSKADADALVADFKSELKNSHPDGRSDIQKYESDEIETFQFDKTLFAMVFKGPWFFVSNDLDLLKSTLGRVDGKIDAKTSLRENPIYQASLAKLPKDSDGVLFVQMKPLLDPLLPQIALAVQDPKQVEGLKKIQGISVGMKLDGEKFRDAIYAYMPGSTAQPPMARNSLAYTSADTVLYFASALNMENAPTLPNPALDKSGFLGVLDMVRQSLATAGLGFEDFKAAFGPELGTVVNWVPSAVQPAVVITLDVRDKAKAQKFIETLTGGQGGAGSWPKQEIDGTLFYSEPGGGIAMSSYVPVLALTDKALIFGIDIKAVQAAVASTKSDGGKLDKTAGFQTASGQVGNPTGAFGYVDTKALFERIYWDATNFLKMAAIFNPHVSDTYGDLSKLPEAEVISKHLGPITYAQSTDANGLLIESAGPVTFSQVVLGLGAAGWTYFEKSQGDASPVSGPIPFLPGTPAGGQPDTVRGPISLPSGASPDATPASSPPPPIAP